MVNRRVCVLFFSTLLLMIFACSAGYRHHKDNPYVQHVQRVHDFPCSKPQMRAIPLSELLSVPSADETFYPTSTVLGRCEGAGCCWGKNQTCGAIEVQHVSLVFLVKHRIDQQRDRHHETIHALHHTKCGCIDLTINESNDV